MENITASSTGSELCQKDNINPFYARVQTWCQRNIAALTAHPEIEEEQRKRWNEFQANERYSVATEKFRRMTPEKFHGIQPELEFIEKFLPAKMSSYYRRQYDIFISKVLVQMEKVKNHEHVNIVIVGDSGIGKSYLACWLIRTLMSQIWFHDEHVEEFYSRVKRTVNGKDEFVFEKVKGKIEIPHWWDCEYVGMKELIRRVKKTESYNATESYQSVMDRLINCDLLVIDECGRSGVPDKEKGLMFDIMDERNKSTIIIGNFLNAQMMQDYYGDAIYDRIKQFMAIVSGDGCASLRDESEYSKGGTNPGMNNPNDIPM